MPEKKYTTTSPNFVAPDNPPKVEILRPTDLPPAPISEPYPLSSYRDRSHGFVLATMPLAAATGFVVLLIGIAGFGVPVLSVAALLLALAGFTVAWLCAYIVHTMVSSEGALFIHVIHMWAYLKREQAERIKRYANRK
jgi:hypothetical protein